MDKQTIYEELNILKAENDRLCGRVEELEKLTTGIFETLKSVVTNVEKIQACENDTDDFVNLLYKFTESERNNYKYESNDSTLSQEDYFYPTFRSDAETIRLITEEKKSLGRFGDAEFSIIANAPIHKYQSRNEKLATRLREVLSAENENLLIGIAKNYGDLSEYTRMAAYGIRSYMTDEVRAQHSALLPKERIYSNGYITRPYVMYKDNMTDAPKKRFNALRAIWEKKDIIMVEGAQTRLGAGNDLFSNAGSIRRILAPAVSSFDRYDDIYRACMKNADSADIFILAIGPSSGVLSHDLSLNGYQAVDVGHIDIEYEWFLRGKGVRTPVPGKYNNEIRGGDIVEEITDSLYEAQIIEACI